MTLLTGSRVPSPPPPSPMFQTFIPILTPASVSYECDLGVVPAWCQFTEQVHQDQKKGIPSRFS